MSEQHKQFGGKAPHGWDFPVVSLGKWQKLTEILDVTVKNNNKDSSEYTDTYHKFKLGRWKAVYSVRTEQKNRGGKHLTVEICQWWAWVIGKKN